MLFFFVLALFVLCFRDGNGKKSNLYFFKDVVILLGGGGFHSVISSLLFLVH